MFSPLVEGPGHGASRIAGGGREDDGVPFFPFQEFFQAGGEEGGSEILEGAGGAVKQLQHRNILIKFYQNGGKGKGPFTDSAGLFLGHFILKQGHRCGSGNFEEGGPLGKIRKKAGEIRASRGMVESSIRGEPLKDALLKGTGVVLVPCTGKQH